MAARVLNEICREILVRPVHQRCEMMKTVPFNQDCFGVKVLRSTQARADFDLSRGLPGGWSIIMAFGDRRHRSAAAFVS